MKLFLVGGFLGSGKTTAISGAGKLLMKEGRRVAVITNDQGDQQVDAQFIRGMGISTREVSNGCFCCHFDELDAHLQDLNKDEQPDFIFAESVGSCTDLVATIAKPMLELRADLDLLITVFADAQTLLSILDGEQVFEEDVLYVYRKQLDEADILVINKIDLLSTDRLKALKRVVKSLFGDKELLFQNSLSEESVKHWMDRASTFKAPFYRHSLDIDYDQYAAGEAGLAWFDQSIDILMPDGKAIAIADKIIHDIHNAIMAMALTIGHLKFYVESEQWKRKISFTIGSRHSLIEWDCHPSTQVQLLINARVQTAPEILENIVKEVLSSISLAYHCSIQENKWSSFRPGYPTPTHRMVNN